MDRKALGRTSLSVTPVCFGGAPLADMPDTFGYSVSEQRARDTINAIFDSGVNFLDTSRNYGLGRSEERIGAAIRDRGGLPDGFVLSSKLDRDMDTGRFDADQVRRSIEESLTALNLDHIPLLHLHDPEYTRDLTEVTRDGGAIDTLFKLREEGLCTAVGLAMGRLDIMEPILGAYQFDALISHNRYTLLNRAADAMFESAHRAGMAILNAAPFAGGVLAKGPEQVQKISYQDVDDAALAPVRAIAQICERYNVPMGAAALAFSMRDPRVTSTIIGVSKPERVAQTIVWANTEIPSEMWAELDALPFATDDPEAARS
ncbi:aldo/keto reductase [Sagittula sp. SSi028]|uniref:aldo/keto reductase n=1 Tax=Sagittula sp. SSi028 TaxID=3400636 RepID=UPI003AF6CF77